MVDEVAARRAAAAEAGRDEDDIEPRDGTEQPPRRASGVEVALRARHPQRDPAGTRAQRR